MKRRDFVKQSTLTAFGASFIAPLAAMAETPVTHLESSDVSPRAALADDFPLHFILLGDWGRNGEYDQLEVARQMGQWATDHPNSFIISAGDNFYPEGVISEFDPLWHYSFENIYTAHSLQCDWYAVLGNHDHMTDPDAQLRYSKISRRWKMPARYYTKEVGLGKNKGKALFVMIDSDPLLSGSPDNYADQIAWINDTLKSAAADVKWKIVVGHHPAYTVGPRIINYDAMAIRTLLSKTFTENKVDVYLSGHEHSLQHLKADGFPHQFISGAGSELSAVTAGVPHCRFQASEHGFMYFSVNENTLEVKAINVGGKVLYETQINK
jgi:tartrate-resistant acid phosphatase type 5